MKLPAEKKTKKRKCEANSRTSTASNIDVGSPSNVESTPPTQITDDYVTSSDDVNLWVLNLGVNLVLTTKIIPPQCQLSNLPTMATQEGFVKLKNELTNFKVINKGEQTPVNGSVQLPSTSLASTNPAEVTL